MQYMYFISFLISLKVNDQCDFLPESCILLLGGNLKNAICKINLNNLTSKNHLLKFCIKIVAYYST